MARGTTLANLRKMLRAEIGSTMNTSSSTQADARHNQLLANKQVWLAASYDWPFLQHEWDLVVPASTQFITLPTSDRRGSAVTINFERAVRVDTLFNNFYFTVAWGIGYGDRNMRNFEINGVVQDPIQRIQVVSNANEPANANQIEIWPVAATQQKLRFVGQRNLQALASDSDTADLDDYLLVLMVASEILSEDESPVAASKAKQAQERLLQLRASYPQEERRIILGRNQLTTKKGKRILIAP